MEFFQLTTASLTLQDFIKLLNLADEGLIWKENICIQNKFVAEGLI